MELLETTYNMQGEVIKTEVIKDIFETPIVPQHIIDAMNERLSQ